MWEQACVGAGLPAMQTPRYISCIEVMLSQASQLPHKPAPTFGPAPDLITSWSWPWHRAGAGPRTGTHRSPRIR
ncbi:hypothetical protein FIV37_05180 [Pseudomonas gessardii]|nr:hypothetical protein [Pseudomonas gessardii]